MNLKRILPVIISFLILFSAFSESGKFKQKISWKADVNAFDYKVELKTPDGKTEYFETDENFISFSKPAGRYQWRVFVYDYLGRESSVSAWQTLNIEKAVQPKVAEVKNKVELPVRIEDSGEAVVSKHVEIPVTVESVTSKSKVELVNTKTNEVVRAAINPEKNAVVVDNAKEGSYKVRVTNPGGLSSESPQIVKIEKQDEAPLRKALAEKKAAEEEAARLAAQKAAEEEAARLAAQKAAEEEAARLAAQKAAEEEAARLAAQKAAEEEAARLAAQKAAEEEAARIAVEQAAAAAAKLAAETAAAEEAARLAAEAAAIEAARVAAEEAARLAAEAAAAEAAEFAKAMEEQHIVDEMAEKSAEEITADLTENSFENDVVAHDDTGKNVKAKVRAYAVYNFTSVPKGMSIKHSEKYNRIVQPKKGKGTNLLIKGTAWSWDNSGFIQCRGKMLDVVEAAAQKQYYNTLVLKIPVQSTLRFRITGIHSETESNAIMLLDKNKDVILCKAGILQNNVQLYQIEKIPAGMYTIAVQGLQVHGIICSMSTEDLTDEEIQTQWDAYLVEHRPDFLNSSRYASLRKSFELSKREAVEGEVKAENIDYFSMTPSEAQSALGKIKVKFETWCTDLTNKEVKKTYYGYSVYDCGGKVPGMSLYTGRYKNPASWFNGYFNATQGAGSKMLIHGDKWRSNGTGFEAIPRDKDNYPGPAGVLHNYVKFTIVTTSDLVLHVSREVSHKYGNNWIALVDSNTLSPLAVLDLKGTNERREFFVKGLKPGEITLMVNNVSIDDAILSVSYEAAADYSEVTKVQKAIDGKLKADVKEKKAPAKGHLTVSAGAGYGIGLDSFLENYTDDNKHLCCNAGFDYSKGFKNHKRLIPGIGMNFAMSMFDVNTDLVKLNYMTITGTLDLSFSFEFIKNRAWIGVKGGPGITDIYQKSKVSGESETEDSYLYVSASGGGFIRLRIVSGLELEGGAVYTKAFGTDYSVIEPYGSLCWRF